MRYFRILGVVLVLVLGASTLSAVWAKTEKLDVATVHLPPKADGKAVTVAPGQLGGAE